MRAPTTQWGVGADRKGLLWKWIVKAMSKSGKQTQAALAEQLIAGTKKHFTSATPVAFAGASFTPAQIETSFQTLIDLRTEVDTAKASAKAKVAAEKAQAPALRTFMAAFVSFVKATFGNSPDVLADFGLKPKKARAPLTVEQKAAAAAKRKATRAARKTMGSKQRKAVKGDVAGIVVTPLVAPPPVAAAPASPSAPTGGTTAGTAPHTA
jgi:hypothetical protein